MVSSEHFLISLKISCVKFASKGDFDSIEIRKSLDIARVFRLPQLFPLGKLLFYVKLFCLGFATKMPIFYFNYIFYFGLLIFCCQSVAMTYYTNYIK